MGVVVTRLYGGLGNQMFQFAAGLAVARRLQSRLYADTLWFDPRVHPAEAPPIRRYGLGVFGISPGVPLGVRLRLKLTRPTVIGDQGVHYQPELQRVEGDVVLDGYWHNYRYLTAVEDDVREVFSLPTELSDAAGSYLDEIRRGNAVALHVRRGDYVSNPKHRRLFGELTPEYYRVAAAELQRRRGRALALFVFSDEPEWCRGNLTFDDPRSVTFVSGTADHEDLSLMASCRDLVIANSSFSWWGAWLANDPDKIVVAPARWPGDPIFDNPDRVPPGWLRL